MTGSVTAAAKLLHVGQPTVTTQLRQLEAAYKVELALRLSTGVKLTETGRQLFTLTEKLFQIQAETVDFLRGVDGRLQGRLRVGSVAPNFVMPPVAAFRAENPVVEVDVTLNDSQTIAEMIADCEVDVGIIGHLSLGNRFLSIPYSRQALVVFVPTDHDWASRSGVTLAELAEEPLAMRKEGSTSRRVLERAFDRKSLSFTTALEVDREGAIEAMRAGIGITVATEAELTAGDDIVALPIIDGGPDLFTDAFVVCLKTRSTAPLVERFIRTAARRHIRSTDSVEEAGRGNG